MVNDYAVVAKLPNGQGLVCPYKGTRQQFYFFLMDWFLDTDEDSPGGMPWLVVEHAGPLTAGLKPNTVPFHVPDWLDAAYKEFKTVQRFERLTA